MGWLKKLVGPANSLLFLFDHLEHEDGDRLEALIEETRQYYDFVKASDAVGKTGKAAILFRNARKSVMMRALPILRGQDIPFTIFLRADCIGLNRLPPEEEKWREAGVEGLNTFDPTRFFATWKNLVELPPRLFEPGLYFHEADAARETQTFIRQQLGRESRVAFSPEQSQQLKSSLVPLGIECLVTPRPGAIDRHTDPFDLPVWPVEENEKEEAIVQDPSP